MVMPHRLNHVFAPPMSDPNPWTLPVPVPKRIETERLVLRPYAHTDAGSLFGAIEVDRGRLLPWLPWAESDNRTIEEVHYTIEFFARREASPDCRNFCFGIFDRQTGEVLGSTSVHNIEPGQHCGSTGYWTRPDRVRRGICTEATGAIITSALTPKERGGWGLRRMTLYCAEVNEASSGVARKLGMRLETRSPGGRYLRGMGYHTELMFAVLACEWDFEKQRAKADIERGIEGC